LSRLSNCFSLLNKKKGGDIFKKHVIGTFFLGRGQDHGEVRPVDLKHNLVLALLLVGEGGRLHKLLELVVGKVEVDEVVEDGTGEVDRETAIACV